MERHDFPMVGECCYYQHLENGLDAFVVSKPGYTKKMAMLAVNYGGMNPEFTLSGEHICAPEGIAHYLEHKMFDMRHGSALTQLSANGAAVNAYTSKDITAYHFSCTSLFEENLRILLRFVSVPWFTPESVEKERGIIAQEIRMYRDNPNHRVYENLLSGLYQHHPIRRSILGTEQSIGEITPELLYRCHNSFYRPQNMVLIVVGDVDPRRVWETAEISLRDDGYPAGVKLWGEEEPMEAGQQRISEEMELSEPTFLLGSKMPPLPEGKKGLRDSLLYSVAAEILCGSSGPLYNRLYQQGLIHKDFSAAALDYPGAACLVLGGDSPQPETVAQAVFEETERIAREGIDEDRFQRTLRSEYGSMVRSLNSVDAICAQFARSWFAGCHFYDFGELYPTLTADEVSRLLGECVRQERSCLSVISPKGGSKA